MKAVAAVRNKRLNASKASKMYSVPRKTLMGYVKGISKEGCISGRGFYLNEADEGDLSRYLVYMADHGWGLGRKEMRLVAQCIKERKTGQKQRMPSHFWARNFIKRHKLSIRKPSAIDKGKSSVSQEILKDFFDKLSTLYEKHNFEDKFILNMDETGFGGSQKKKVVDVIAKRGSAAPYQRNLVETQHITFCACISAAGDILTPFLVFTKYLPSSRKMTNLPSSWIYKTSEKGFMTRNLFEQWFEECFMTYIEKERKSNEAVLLTLDNHESHLSEKVVHMAIEKNIHILTLPPNTSHLVQPLDKIFGQMKHKFQEITHATSLVSTNVNIGKCELPRVLQQSIDEAWSKHVIKMAFKQVRYRDEFFPSSKVLSITIKNHSHCLTISLKYK